ncbi:transaldolase [Candidatus Poribacteria bacterium]|nr:transaldolase [Candidatus Poribacteria bacterium]
MKAAYNDGVASGFTTNPSLMKKAGVVDYAEFAKDVLCVIPDLPISFEVFSDEFSEMERQAQYLDSLGDNVYVKIPITNTKNESSVDLIESLVSSGVKVNVTAIMTLDQVVPVKDVLDPNVPAVVSIFSGRIADTGVDPVPVMRDAARLLSGSDKWELLWASPREILNLYQAEDCGCDIITMTPDLISKTRLKNKDLLEYSLETVKMFYDDANKQGYRI